MTELAFILANTYATCNESNNPNTNFKHTKNTFIAGELWVEGPCFLGVRMFDETFRLRCPKAHSEVLFFISWV